jgi:predicted RNase H-like nuclease (RuvC/YqgF family)
MADENTNTPEQQENNSSGQQDGGNQSTTDWESRFKGLQRKYNTLMEADGVKDEQLSKLQAEKERLEKQVDQLSVEKDSLSKDNQTKIDELTSTLTEKEQELAELSQIQLKVEVANDLGHPELLQLIDAVPDTDDRDQVEKAMKSIIGFTKSQVEKREQQLTDGLMPGETSNDRTPKPETEEGWNDYIESLTLGSDEYNNAMDAYFNWTRKR